AMRADMGVPALLAIACIALMVALHVWGTASLKTYIVLIGLAAGYVVAFALGLVPSEDIRLPPASTIQWPIPELPWPVMAVNLMLPFAIAAIASSLRAIGDLTTVQKINDARWLRPDMRVIRGGLAATGVGTMVCG